jgi:cyclic pyranopterin phosphate synthase
MVDVSDKEVSVRKAMAEGWIRMSPDALARVQEGEGPKGDVLQVARLAGIQAGKKTGDLIPLCHLLPAVSLSVDLRADPDLPGIRVRSAATLKAQTGVEMEALTAVSVALLTVYDMAKAMDRSMTLGGIRLVSKAGGRSGAWNRGEEE